MVSQTPVCEFRSQMLINCVFDSIHSSLGVRRYCGLRPTHTRVPPGLFGVLPYLAPRAPRARPRGPSSVFCCVRAVPLRRPLALAWYVSTIRVRSGNSSPLEFWAHEATGVRSWKRCAQSNGATSTGLISWSWRGQADRSVTVAVSNQIMMIIVAPPSAAKGYPHKPPSRGFRDSQ